MKIKHIHTAYSYGIFIFYLMKMLVWLVTLSFVFCLVLGSLALFCVLTMLDFSQPTHVYFSKTHADISLFIKLVQLLLTFLLKRYNSQFRLVIEQHHWMKNQVH